MATETPTATALPNTPSAPASADPAISMTPAQIQARIASMNAQVEAQRTPAAPAPAPTSPAPAPVNVQGLTAPQMSQAATGQPVQTGYVAPSRQVGTTQEPVTYQQGVATGEIDRERRVREVMQMNNISEADARARMARAEAFERGEVERPTTGVPGQPLGVGYDASTGTYRDPLTMRHYAGFDPKLGHIFTDDEREAIGTIYKEGAEPRAILTSEDLRSAEYSVSSALSRAQDNPLPHSGRTTRSGGQTGEDPLTLGMPPELARLQQEIESWNSAEARTSPFAEQNQRLAARKSAAIEDIHARASAQYEEQKIANKQALGKVRVMMANLGILGSTQDLQFTADTIREGDKALGAIADSERRAINEAVTAFEEKEFQMAVKSLEFAENKRKEYWNMNTQLYQLKQGYQEQLQRRQEFNLRVEEAAQNREVRQLEIDNKREEAATKRFEVLAKAGYEYNEQSAPTFRAMERKYNLPEGYSKSYFEVAKQDAAAKQAKSESERTKMEYDNAKTLIDIQSKVPLGKTFTVNGVEYAGFDRGAIKTGTESDSFGNVTFYSYDTNTGKTTTTSLGNIGSAKDGWTLTQTDQGWVYYNDKTKTSVPAQASISQTTIQTILPEGSRTNPFRPEKGASGVQCGELMNDCNDPSVGRIWRDSFKDKLATAQGVNPVTGEKWGVPIAQAQVGDTVIQSGGDTGHVMRILDIHPDKNGRTQWTVLEANRQPPGGGSISSTRQVYPDDPKNAAAARVPTRQGLFGGSDSKFTTEVISGPTIGGKPIGEVLGGQGDGKTFAATTELRKEFQNLQEVKDFKIIRDSFSQIKEVTKAPSAAGDLSMIFSYMKMLDPTSAVRETEFANAQNAAGVPDRIRNQWNKLKSGERLNENQRTDFSNQAQNLYNSKDRQLEQTRKQYRKIATKGGLDPDDVILEAGFVEDEQQMSVAPSAGQTQTIGGLSYSWDGTNWVSK